MELYALLDLDNMMGWSGSGSNRTDEVIRAFREGLVAIEREAEWRIDGGTASMNRVTRQALDAKLDQVLGERNIDVVVVPSSREEADKSLGEVLGLAIGRGRRDFVVMSGDHGYARSFARFNDAGILALRVAVVTSSVTPGLIDAYEGTAAEFFGLRDLEEARPTLPQVPDLGPELPPICLRCKFCGRRETLADAHRGARCRKCGTKMESTDRTVVPKGAVPWRDGPILEVWFGRERVRIVVLPNSAVTFGRGPASPTGPDVLLGDLVSAPEKISGIQFQVWPVNGDTWQLVRRGGRHMFTATLNQLDLNNTLSLTNGTEFWLNDPHHSNDASALLRFVYRSDPR